MTKEIEDVKRTASVQNQGYQNFLKEKLIFESDRDHMQDQMRQLEGLLQSQQYKTMEDIGTFKTIFNLKLEEVLSQLNKVTVDNGTTRSLVKKQTDEFPKLFSQIELSKEEIKKLQKAIDSLPVTDDLYWTDEYIDKYLPFKIQNMISDTLIHTSGIAQVKRLIDFE